MTRSKFTVTMETTRVYNFSYIAMTDWVLWEIWGWLVIRVGKGFTEIWGFKAGWSPEWGGSQNHKTPNLVFYTPPQNVKMSKCQNTKSDLLYTVPYPRVFFSKKTQSFGLRNRTPKLCVFFKKNRKSRVRNRTWDFAIFRKKCKVPGYGTVPRNFVLISKKQNYRIRNRTWDTFFLT